MGRTRFLAGLLVACAFVAGCGRTAAVRVEPESTITVNSGTDQLVLMHTTTQYADEPDTIYGEFHSLVWRRWSEGAWVDHVVIDASAFQGASPRDRWVSRIHALDPEVGTAIVQVAEADAPPDARSIRIVYSWREWHLSENREVRTIQICDDPFEPFAGG